MKYLKSLLLFSALFFSVSFLNAQVKSEMIPVSGNCGMCKDNIEGAAKKAGVTEANWNKNTKMLAVKYDLQNTNATKIQKAVADVGYDTRDIRGNDSAYQSLEPCCHYDRVKKYPRAKVVANKAKGGDMACCEKKDEKCCTDKLAAQKVGKKVECKDDKQGKGCCEKK